MSLLHPTIADKNREVGMSEDFEWHITQVRDFDGNIEPFFAPPLLPGDDALIYRTYTVETNLRGRVITPPTRKVIDVRYDRFPVDPDDNGTAWDRIDLRELVDDEWYGSFSGKIEIYRDGSYSTKVGIGYRISDGAVKITDRVVKFIRERDS